MAANLAFEEKAYPAGDVDDDGAPALDDLEQHASVDLASPDDEDNDDIEIEYDDDEVTEVAAVTPIVAAAQPVPPAPIEEAQVETPAPLPPTSPVALAATREEAVAAMRPQIHAATERTYLDRFLAGEIDSMPLDEFLPKSLGFDSIAPGYSSLWYVGDGASGGEWLYMYAPAAKGAVKDGYPIVMACGVDDKEIKVEVCALLHAQRDGLGIKFDKGGRVEMSNGKVELPALLNEAEVVGHIRGKNFGRAPFHFKIDGAGE